MKIRCDFFCPETLILNFVNNQFYIKNICNLELYKS